MIDRLLGLAERRNFENPRVSLQDPDAWDALFGTERTEAGITVTPEKALAFAAVWQCISMISGDVAKLPLDVYRRVGGEKREHASQHWAYKLIRRQANRESTAFHFWRTMMVHALLWGNAYAYINRGGAGGINSKPLELIPLLPDRTSAERVDGELTYFTESRRPNTGAPWLRPMPAADVLHIRGFSFGGIAGESLLRAAREAFALALQQQKFLSRYYKHGVRSGGILELPAGMGDKASKKLIEGFRKFDSEREDQWFKVAILRDGAKFHQTSLSLENSQTNESREHQVREACRYFNCPPGRLGLSDSVSYNSMTEANQSYLDSTLSLWLEAITSECYVKLLSGQEQADDSHYFEHETRALLRMNPLQRHQVYAIGLRNAMYSPDECRQAENMNPREDGRGGEYVSLGKPVAGGSSDGGPDNIPADGGDNTKNNPQAPVDQADDAVRTHKMRRLAFRLGDHARVKARSEKALLEWIDGGLASHRADAEKTLGSAELVDRFLSDLRGLVEKVTSDRLADAVDRLATDYEMAV